MNENYHTALNSKKNTNKIVEGTQRFETKNCLAFTYDFIPKQSLPNEYDKCDFLYVEVPYPQGIKIFDERANVKETRTVDDFALALSKIIMDTKIPIGIVTSKILHKKLPPANSIHEMSIHVGKVTFAMHNYILPFQFQRSTDLMQYVANNFNCLGDFCCGYGYPLIQYLKFGGKKIIASDYNSQCITILKKNMELHEKNL